MSERGKRQLDLSSDSSSIALVRYQRKELFKKGQLTTGFRSVTSSLILPFGLSMTWLIASTYRMRNFRLAFIDGTTNVRISTVKDHAGTDMHVTIYKQRSSSICKYASVARSLSEASMDVVRGEKTKRKFAIVYILEKETLAFTKMSSVCKLEEWHGVNIGARCKTDRACMCYARRIYSS